MSSPKSKSKAKTKPQWERENEELRARLAEAEQTLQAIREGEVDAVVVSGSLGEQVYSLTGAESVYRLITETMWEAAFTVALDGRILFCNGQFSPFVRTPQEQIIGRLLYDFVPAEQRSEVAQLLVRSQTEPVRQRLVFQCPGTPAIPAYVSTTLLHQPDSLSVLMIATDLTELENSTETIQQLRRQEQVLRESEERFRTAFDQGAIAMSLTALDSRLVRVNRAFCEMLGFSEAELIGHSFIDFTHPDDLPKNRAGTERLVSGEAPSFRMEKRYIHKDGSVTWGDMCAAAVHDAGGRPLYLITHVQDITARKRAEEALRWANERFRLLLNAIPVGVTIAEDPQCQSITTNPAGARMFETPEGQNISASARQPPPHRYFHQGKELRPEEMPMQLAVFGNREVLNMEIEAHLASGRRWIGLISASPLHDPEGRVIGGIAVARDITDRKRAEETIHESQARLQAAFASMTEAIFIADAEGRLIDFNDEFVRYHRFKNRDECSKTIADCPKYLDVWFPDGTPAPVEQWAMPRALRGETASNVEYRLRRRETGESWWGSYSFAPIKDQDGRITGAIVVASEVTERKAAEEAIRQAAEELRRSNEELQQFAHIASHDLQEPLRVVSGFLKLLEDRYKPQLDEKAREYISYSVEGARRMSQLISDLLAYSRVAGKEQEMQPVDANKVLTGALANLHISIQEAGATVTHDVLPTVAGDAVQLSQLLQNLIGNAIKFRKQDGPCQVHVGAQKNDNEWVFSVRDNGIGIDPAQHDRIFVIFQRLHEREKYPGTGIGLAICKKIVERHGGRIWVESKVGEGATFYFTLPEDRSV